ncbi:1,2-epoxyphenylacetyl-CoA isomerase [compost metagenome]
MLLAEAEQPVIGSVQGPVSGAGMSIALGCDLTLAARTTRFCPAYLAIAASLDAGGSWHLVRQLGLQRAMQVALLNQVVSADQALAWGLVSQVVEPELLAEVTDELATRLARGPRHAQGQVKSLLRGAMNRDFSSQLVAEHDAFVSCASQADFREGVSAFFDKRDAHY